MYANLVILQYLGSLFTWDKVFKVLRPLPNRIKNQRLLVHILHYISFIYLGEISLNSITSQYLFHDWLPSPGLPAAGGQFNDFSWSTEFQLFPEFK